MTTPFSTGDLDYQMSSLASGAVLHDWSVKHPRAIVILQHGFAEYAERFLHEHRSLILHFTKRNFRVMAMDLCGHGRSSGKRGLVDAQKAVHDHVHIRRLAEKANLPIFLFGHSLGGLITMGSAVTSSDRVCGIVVAGPVLPLPASRIFSKILDFFAEMMPNVAIPTSKLPYEALARDPKVARAFKDDPLTVKQQIPFLLAATATRVANMVWEEAPQMKSPVLILHGTNDAHVNPRGSKRLMEVIGALDKQLLLYGKGRHELLDDLDGEEVMNNILAWFDRVAPAQEKGVDENMIAIAL